MNQLHMDQLNQLYVNQISVMQVLAVLVSNAKAAIPGRM